MKNVFRYIVLSILLASFPYNFLRAMDDCPHCDHLRDECFTIKTSVKQRGGGSTGKWKDDITPKRGWSCVGAEDLGAENFLQCDMCEREHPRYIHHMVHGRSEPLKVGCHCAAYMEGRLDDANHLKERLAAANKRENRLVRREKFPDLKRPKWNISRNGNPYIAYQGSHIVIFPNYRGGTFGASVNKQPIPGSYGSVREAKLAAFDYIDPQ